MRGAIRKDRQGVPVQSISNNQPMDELERELLNGQKLQGAATAQEVNIFLKARGKTNEFPLFTAVYEIVFEGRDARTVTQVGDGR